MEGGAGSRHRVPARSPLTEETILFHKVSIFPYTAVVGPTFGVPLLPPPPESKQTLVQ